LEDGAAASLGAAGASIGLWDQHAARLTFFSEPPQSRPAGSTNRGLDNHESSAAPTLVTSDGTWDVDPVSQPPIGRAFLDQRAGLVTDLGRADHDSAPIRSSHASGAHAALAAPITAGDRRLGVLVIFAPRAPTFVNSDLELVQLLADQAAVALESRE